MEQKDEYGKLTVYLLPFLRPDMLRAYEKNCPQTYHEAVKQVLKELPYNKKERNSSGTENKNGMDTICGFSTCVFLFGSK